jgi:hypothetical protein
VNLVHELYHLFLKYLKKLHSIFPIAGNLPPRVVAEENRKRVKNLSKFN